MSDQIREEFEAAYVEDMVRIMGEGIRRRATENTKFLMQNGEFQDPALRLALWAWKASRESMPAGYTAVDMTTANSDGYKNGFAAAIKSLPEQQHFTNWAAYTEWRAAQIEAVGDFGAAVTP